MSRRNKRVRVYPSRRGFGGWSRFSTNTGDIAMHVALLDSYEPWQGCQARCLSIWRGLGEK
jgi:hypothetical protein